MADDKPAVIDNQTGLEKMPLEEIRNMFCPSATDKELKLFMNIALANHLNPFKREIHMTKYNTKDRDGKLIPVCKIIIGYEVYLKRAERTMKVNGWKCEIVKGKDAGDDKAVLTIHRKDWNEPFIWDVTRKEVTKGQATWTQMPDFMLKKVAIAQGMRLCFPDEMGGLPYLEEETGYLDKGKPEVETPKAIDEKIYDVTSEEPQKLDGEEVQYNPPTDDITSNGKLGEKASKAQIDFLSKLLLHFKDKTEEKTSGILQGYKVSSFEELTKREASEIISVIKDEVYKDHKEKPKAEKTAEAPAEPAGNPFITIAKLITKASNPGNITNFILEKYTINTFNQLKPAQVQEILTHLEAGEETWK